MYHPGAPYYTGRDDTTYDIKTGKPYNGHGYKNGWPLGQGPNAPKQPHHVGSPVIHDPPAEEISISTGAGFPPGTTWRYEHPNKRGGEFQAWLSELEYDSTSGWHYNLHFQPLGGGEDYHNYHITFVSNPTEYIWKVYDSKTGRTQLYTWPKPQDCTCEGIGGVLDQMHELREAATYLSLQFAGDVGQIGSALNDDIQDGNFVNAAWDALNQAFLTLAEKAGAVEM